MNAHKLALALVTTWLLWGWRGSEYPLPGSTYWFGRWVVRGEYQHQHECWKALDDAKLIFPPYPIRPRRNLWTCRNAYEGRP